MAAKHQEKRMKLDHQRPITASAVSEQPKDAAKPAQNPPQKKKTKPPPPPTTIPPNSLLEDLSVWNNAVLLIDKPKGWTSFDVCGKLRGSVAALLRRKNREIKVGHAGTLDPMATGLLIVCVGKATKSIDNFVAMQKEYSGVLKLGQGTDSYDAEGEVIETLPWEHITDEELFSARDKFLGEIDQLPPMFSAIKVGGKRLYEAAREGKEVERAARRVKVDRFDLERQVENFQEVGFYVECSKGTYIRSLAYDLGKAVGSAAHLTALRREAIGEFRVTNAWKMEDLANALKEQREKLQSLETTSS